MRSSFLTLLSVFRGFRYREMENIFLVKKQRNKSEPSYYIFAANSRILALLAIFPAVLPVMLVSAVICRFMENEK